ncbi:MAG: NAD(P)-dependent glycerol-3-phosphate dehydrogenase [Verrucomicrobia bacterium]|nr:NAD(P)-dependent glycerol-3-phosphate dehydrogenase [Verrucomicrobiota bacterium]
MSNRRITVIGDGGWGTALAIVLNSNGHRVRVWGPFADYIAEVNASRENRKFLPGIDVPPDIEFTADREQATDKADAFVLAVPTKFYGDVMNSFKGLVTEDQLVVSVAKGLHRETHKRMSELAEGILECGPVAALSGPSHAEEVARGVPTAVVIACKDHGKAEVLQQLFSNERFRAYTSDDVIGVELGGALKNVIAIAAGASDGIGFGDNTKAALITRGLAEIMRLGAAMGAHPATFSGLSGMGDLIVTCASRLSRNRSVGERLGKGESIDRILASMEQVAEGVWNCTNARDLAREIGVEVPITEQVYAVINEGADPRAAVQSLMTRVLKHERE